MVWGSGGNILNIDLHRILSRFINQIFYQEKTEPISHYRKNCMYIQSLGLEFWCLTMCLPLPIHTYVWKCQPKTGIIKFSQYSGSTYLLLLHKSHKTPSFVISFSKSLLMIQLQLANPKQSIKLEGFGIRNLITITVFAVCIHVPMYR